MASPGWGDVDGVFAGEAVAGSVVESAQRAPSDDFMLVVAGDEDGVVMGDVIFEPRDTMIEGAGVVVVAGGGVEDGVVIDIEDGLEILALGGADESGWRGWGRGHWGELNKLSWELRRERKLSTMWEES